MLACSVMDPDTPEPEEGTPDIQVGLIEIELSIDARGRMIMRYEESTPGNEDLGLMEVLGALELAKDTAIRSRMGGE